VLDCDYRHPVPLARELATIDQLSEGRLELGLGGVEGARLRARRHPDGTARVRQPAHRAHDGAQGVVRRRSGHLPREHYTITDLEGTPKPTAPAAPDLIGGGAPRLLRFAGATADIVGVNASIHSGAIDAAAAQDGLATAIDQKVAWVREGAGERFDELELNAWLAIAEVTDDAASFAELIAPAFEARPEDVLESPLSLIGSATQIAERLEERRARWGYSYHVIPGDKVRDFAPIVAQLTGR
jgi:alkanesulfonate monooxygenase SsuD/methylene tetrahydromethanopterin reductase-like flavin-dependent oxidoreductase (luciferase family)